MSGSVPLSPAMKWLLNVRAARPFSRKRYSYWPMPICSIKLWTWLGFAAWSTPSANRLCLKLA